MTYCRFSGSYLRGGRVAAEREDTAWVGRGPSQYGNRKGPIHAWDS